MRPLTDLDVLILMAAALAAKRRPAELVEIVAAADLLQGHVPYLDKLGEAVERLAVHGLIAAAEGGLTLTPAALDLMADQPRKADTEERIAVLRGRLAGYAPQAEGAAIRLTREQLEAAIKAHKDARKTSATNLLMPKPKADRHFKVEGRWRRAPGTRPRKA